MPKAMLELANISPTASNQIGQALTPEFRITVDACPAAFFHLFKGVFETAGCGSRHFRNDILLIAHGIQGAKTCDVILPASSKMADRKSASNPHTQE